MMRIIVMMFLCVGVDVGNTVVAVCLYLHLYLY